MDSQGRMKLSVEVIQHFGREVDNRIFVTSVVPGVVSMYPAQVWQQNLQFLAEQLEDAEEAADLEFWANAHGATTTIDGQGRVVVPILLREKFGLDGEALVMVPARDRIDIYKQAQFDERCARVAERLANARESMVRKGFA